MKVMVFDVGGTEIKYSVMDEQLNRADAGSVPTPGDTQEHFLATLEALYRPHAAEVDGIAMSLPGFIDAEHGVVRGGGAPSLLYNIGTPVGPRLAQRCGCRVFLENDGKAAAIAELQLGRPERLHQRRCLCHRHRSGRRSGHQRTAGTGHPLHGWGIQLPPHQCR